ncbi:MAG: hypothetical protein P0Y49_13720 [Candidatus Pedobacter colombiensis]|uniref:DUF3945 domain-containing protein n=1 Tax=Candidatus Pedobacter colombiensis TaxID=3121371 RepID=A0AAJ5W4K3_9SPHI|nr:hypothetical protein [Pedobacter sp.]WEK17857.1 MAG: hypothetical protein P0Y49_13720 [Pedobacter sp.]
MNKINLNNLFDLKEDMKALGASEQSLNQLEENIRKGSASFEILESKQVLNGHIDIRYPIKTSDPEKGYYFSNFKAQFYGVKPLEEGHSYFLITPNGEGKNDTKKFDHPMEAIEQFKKRDRDCELVVGKSVTSNSLVAKREKNEVVVTRDYRNALFGKPTEQTFYCQEGKGFTVQQAANLVQGRSVFRDDLATRQGEKYQAWVNLDTEKGKTGQNFQLKTYRDPAYGFDLKNVLKDYNIKFLKNAPNQPQNLTELETALRNGDKPIIGASNKGVDMELQLETAVRFRKMNFFKLDGTPEKRELFLTKEAQVTLAQNTKAKENDLSEAQGLTR